MFCVSEDEAITIRAAFEQEGEMSAGIELWRLFPGITDGARAREMARVIVGWRPVRAVPSRDDISKQNLPKSAEDGC